jgi:hypothetical protein
MAHNFQQWWENGTGNIMSIASYKTNSQRKYGVQQRDIASSQLHNRLFYQLSTFVTAFANMMDAKGYALSESNISTLASQLSNVMTKYDLDTVYKYATQSWVKNYYGGYGTGVSGGVLSYYYTKTQVNSQISAALTSALAPYATISYVDVTKKATAAEIISGLLDSKYISPLALAGSIATSAQIIAGSSGYRFMIAAQYIATKATLAHIIGAPTNDYSNRWIDPEGLFSAHASAAMINSGSVNYQGYIIDPYQLALSDYATKTWVSGEIDEMLTRDDFTGATNQKKAAKGFQVFPGGYIRNWGTITIARDSQAAIDFEKDFVSNCYGVTATIMYGSSTGAGLMNVYLKQAPTKTGAILIYDWANSAPDTVTVYWEAYGY